MKLVSKDIPYLYLRGKTYVFRRSIPPHHRTLANRPEFKKTLKTKDYDEALAQYSKYKKFVDGEFEKLERGIELQKRSFESYAEEAQIFGRNNIDLVSLRPNKIELLGRLKAFNASSSQRPDDFLTYLNASARKIRMSELIDVYTEVDAIKLSTKSSRERGVRIAGLKNAVSVLEDHLKTDKFLDELTREDARSFHKMLTKLVVGDGSLAEKKIASNTAQKYIIGLRVLIKSYYKHNDIEGGTVFDGLSFDKINKQRPNIPVEFIKDKWLTGNPFANLNDCARNLLFAVLDTGCNFKELCGLDAKSEILLNHKIPHLIIRVNNSRGVKAEARTRTMPLVGKALEAFQAFPNGFLRYANQSGHGNASAVINKFLRENDLVENNEQTVYSLRHTFKDRLRKHKTNEELSHALMGHRYKTTAASYGEGYDLEAQFETMKRLATDWD